MKMNTSELISALEEAPGPDAELLFAAFALIHGGSKTSLRATGFQRLLALQAWTSAAEMLMPEGYRIDYIKWVRTFGLFPEMVEATIFKASDQTRAARCYYGYGFHHAHAIATACLRAKEIAAQVGEITTQAAEITRLTAERDRYKRAWEALGGLQLKAIGDG